MIMIIHPIRPSTRAYKSSSVKNTKCVVYVTSMIEAKDLTIYLS